ncbi:hypothetical protein BZG36_00962 [Bifiguratus adelaidae]|uniref:FAS1 domain-containing protein n=1 Tax=Bifiguratus adelaidae TaxID=1938954 RepID=A0A261Y6B8_9FUNG|nr:hypothetical protein BZG36_00962 [Bifiguratus adelaidae]
MMNSHTLSATNDTRDIWALHMMVGKHSMADLQQMSSTMPLSTMLNDPNYMHYVRKTQITTQTILLGANISSPTSGQLWSGLPTQAANIIQSDIECSNGYIHIIDQVMDLPPTNDNAIRKMSQTAKMFNVLTNLNMTFNSLSFYGQTLFAPSNGGITLFSPDQILVPTLDCSSILTSSPKLDRTHGGTVNIVKSPDRSWTVNGLNVSVPNVMTRYGIIHVVDGVFDPLAQNARDNATVNGVVGQSKPVKSSATQVSIASLLAALPMLVASLHC